MRSWAIVCLALFVFLALSAEGRAESTEGNGAVPEAQAPKAGKTVTTTGHGNDIPGSKAGGSKTPAPGGSLAAVAKVPSRAAGTGRPEAAAKRPATTAKAASATTHEAVVAVSSPRHLGYAPVADGGGLTLYLANLEHPGAEATGSPDERISDFASSKNRYSIEVRLSQHRLYLYENLPDGSRHLARTYVVAVPGHDMEAPQGWGVVTGISFEPWWRPTPAMKERARKKGRTLPEAVRPGVKENPMGTFKIILSHGYGFRIHGNNNPGSIGRPVTSGCIRMRNDEGRDMAKLIDVGTEVVFLQ